MFSHPNKRPFSFIRRIVSVAIIVTFLATTLIPPAQAQSILNLPVPGTMVMPTDAFVPVMLKGMTIHPENPLKFDFIVDNGNTAIKDEALKGESSKLVKYFLASLTVPEKELWVNLSPNEKDKIIPDALGQTDLGQDLLAQDYILKQLTASLMYPEDELGQKFWDKIYKQAQEQYGTTDIPIDTFNKVWIIPESASVYEHGNTVYITSSHLKVLTDADYFSSKQYEEGSKEKAKDKKSLLTTQVIKEVIIPAIEKEVNEGENFAPLRQIYQSLILAKWYKETLKDSILNRAYADQNKIAGIYNDDPAIKEKIYSQYMKAYKKGVYDYMREEYDTVNREIVPRKYFSGGFKADVAMAIKREDASISTQIKSVGDYSEVAVELEGERKKDSAMAARISLSDQEKTVVAKRREVLLFSLASFFSLNAREESLLLDESGGSIKLFLPETIEGGTEYLEKVYQEFTLQNAPFEKIIGTQSESKSFEIFLRKKADPLSVDPSAIRLNLTGDFDIEIIPQKETVEKTERREHREDIKFISVLNALTFVPESARLHIPKAGVQNPKAYEERKKAFVKFLGVENAEYFDVIREVRIQIAKERANLNDIIPIIDMQKGNKNLIKEFEKRFEEQLKRDFPDKSSELVLRKLRDAVSRYIDINDLLMEVVNKNVEDGIFGYDEALKLLFLQQIQVGIVGEGVVEGIKNQTSAVNVRRVNGDAYGFNLQYNPERANRGSFAQKDMKKQETNISVGFIEQWFPLQRYIPLREDNGGGYHILANPFPHLRNSFNIVRNFTGSKQEASFLSFFDIYSFLEKAQPQKEGQERFRVFMNSRFAGASFDHLHFQGFFKKTAFEKVVESKGLELIAQDERNGVRYSRLKEGDYWMPTVLAVEGTKKEKVVRAVLTVLERANPDGNFFNVLKLRRNSKFSYNVLFKYDGTKYTAYIFVRKFVDSYELVTEGQFAKLKASLKEKNQDIDVRKILEKLVEKNWADWIDTDNPKEVRLKVELEKVKEAMKEELGPDNFEAIFSILKNAQSVDPDKKIVEKGTEIKKGKEMYFRGRPATIEMLDTFIFDNPDAKKQYEALRIDAGKQQVVFSELGKELAYDEFDSLVEFIQKKFVRKNAWDAMITKKILSYERDFQLSQAVKERLYLNQNFVNIFDYLVKKEINFDPDFLLSLHSRYDSTRWSRVDNVHNWNGNLVTTGYSRIFIDFLQRSIKFGPVYEGTGETEIRDDPLLDELAAKFKIKGAYILRTVVKRKTTIYDSEASDPHVGEQATTWELVARNEDAEFLAFYLGLPKAFRKMGSLAIKPRILADIKRGVRVLGQGIPDASWGIRDKSSLLFEKLGLPYPKGIVLSPDLVKQILGKTDWVEYQEAVRKKLVALRSSVNKYQFSFENYSVRSNPLQYAPGIYPSMKTVNENMDRGRIEPAIRFIYDSWYSDEAKEYRESKGLPNEYNMPILLQEKPYRGRQKDITGIFSTSHPGKNNDVLSGRYILDTEGKNLIRKLDAKGIDISELAKSHPEIYQQLLEAKVKLEKAVGPQEVEFIVRDGKLFFLQTHDLSSSSQGEIANLRQWLKTQGIISDVQVAQEEYKPMRVQTSEEITIPLLNKMLKATDVLDPEVDKPFLTILKAVRKINPNVDLFKLFRLYRHEQVQQHLEEFNKSTGIVTVRKETYDEHDRYGGEVYNKIVQDGFFIEFLKEYMKIPDVSFRQKAFTGNIRKGSSGDYAIDPDHYYTQYYEDSYVAPKEYDALLRFCVLTRDLGLRQVVFGESDEYKIMVDSGIRFLGKETGDAPIGNKEKGFLIFDRLGINYPKGIVLSKELVKKIMNMSDEGQEVGVMFYLLEALSKVGIDTEVNKLSVRSNPEQSMPGILTTKTNVSTNVKDLYKAIKEVVGSWQTGKAVKYREKFGLADTESMPIIIQEWKSGKRPDRASYHSVYGAGVFSTRNPDTGEDMLLGRYFNNGEGEGLMTEGQRGEDINTLSEAQPEIYQQLLEVKTKLDEEVGPQEVEFVVNNGRVYFLQTRDLKFSLQGEVAFIKQLLGDKKITQALAIPQLEELQKRMGEKKIFKIKEGAKLKEIARADASTPGAFQGYLAFTEEQALSMMQEKKPIVFVFSEKNIWAGSRRMNEYIRGKFLELMFDYPNAVLMTNYGNSSSHEAVLTRDSGRPSLINVQGIFQWDSKGIKTIEGVELKEGDQVVIDGDNGILYQSAEEEDVLEEDGVVFDASYGISLVKMREAFLAPYWNEDGSIRAEFTVERLEELNKKAAEKFKRIQDGNDQKAVFVANAEKHFLHNLWEQKKAEQAGAKIIAKEDNAMSVQEAPGGIDMNAIPVERQSTGADIRFDMDAVNESLINNVEGFSPVIINITPITNIFPLLGLAVPEEPNSQKQDISRKNLPAKEFEEKGVIL